MPDSQRARLSVSTWSLHRTLGSPPAYEPQDEPVDFGPAAGVLPLLALPARLAEFGIHTLEICHFHLPSREPSYLGQLRHALNASGTQLFSLLIDGGDISNPDTAARDLAWTESWLDVAEELGACNARVSAGKSSLTPENLARSRAGFERLAGYVDGGSVRLMTENWHSLLSNAAAVNELLDALDGRVGLCADFGNWSGPDKYDELAAILPRAASCHAKCSFISQTDLDRDDFERCLALSRAASFTGPYTLIYDGPGEDEWLGLDLERDVVRPYLA